MTPCFSFLILDDIGYFFLLDCFTVVLIISVGHPLDESEPTGFLAQSITHLLHSKLSRSAPSRYFVRAQHCYSRYSFTFVKEPATTLHLQVREVIVRD